MGILYSDAFCCSVGGGVFCFSTLPAPVEGFGDGDFDAPFLTGGGGGVADLSVVSTAADAC